MPSDQIQDGRGTGNRAGVTEDGKLLVFATTETEETNGVHNSTSFNIETSKITLTSGSKSGILYVQNDETLDLIITGFFMLTGGSTGGSGDIETAIEYNPTATGSTLVSAGTDVAAVNKNVGSSVTLNATIKEGVEGSTVDAGLKKISSMWLGPGRLVVPITINLPKGRSVALTITPQTGNTSMAVIAAVDVYIKQDF